MPIEHCGAETRSLDRAKLNGPDPRALLRVHAGRVSELLEGKEGVSTDPWQKSRLTFCVPSCSCEPNLTPPALKPVHPAV